MTARERLDMLLDEGERIEIGNEISPKDILNFKDNKKYTDRLSTAKAEINEDDALIVQCGKLNKQNVVVASLS